MSAPYIMKIIGDRMLPWGTPDISFTDSEIAVPIFTHWLWSVRKDMNQLHAFLSNPYIFSFLQNSVGHSCYRSVIKGRLEKVGVKLH